MTDDLHFLWNLATHIVAVGYTNFLPVSEVQVAPKELPDGCKKMQVTGNYCKSIHPAYLSYEYCTS